VEVCETLRLHITESAYHAIVILDRFLSINFRKFKKDMEQSQIMLQALCCLFIAAKNYEKDPNVPSSRKFLRQLPGYKPTQAEQQHEQMLYQNQMNMLNGQAVAGFNSQKNQLVAQEVKILNHIGFDLDSFPAFFDIVEILMAQGIVFTNDNHLNSAVNDERITNQVEKFVDILVMICLQDHKLVNTN
jgi:hypothetical protein